MLSESFNEDSNSNFSSVSASLQIESAHSVFSTLALGCSRLGSVLTPLSRSQSHRLLEAAFDLGIRHFDTANVYGQGDSERYLGDVFASRREQVCIATKAGQQLSRGQALLVPFKRPLRLIARQQQKTRHKIAHKRSLGLQKDFRSREIVASLEKSLRRLRTDYVDVLYLHAPAAQTLTDDSFETLARTLQRDGKIRSFGISCDDLSTAEIASTLGYVEVLQLPLDDGETGRNICAQARAHGKTVVIRRGSGSSTAGNYPQELINSFRPCWHIAHAFLVGTTNAHHLAEVVDAFELERNSTGSIRGRSK